MKKIINESRIEFINEDTNEIIMYIDYSTDECAWYFNGSDEIIVTNDMELFKPIKELMQQQYVFNDDEILRNYQTNNKLVWFSDCYYNPDDEWSRNSVSYLTITCEEDIIKLKCVKPLDAIMGKKSKSHVIIFSPLGNGRYSRNVKSGLTLQDDFVIMVYQELLKDIKIKKYKK